MPSIKRTISQPQQYVKVHDKFYDSSQWRRKRKEFFNKSNLCDYCLVKGIARIAKYLDHLLNRRMWPELEWEDSNLRRACTECDNRKRRLESLYNDKIKLGNELNAAGFK